MEFEMIEKQFLYNYVNDRYIVFCVDDKGIDDDFTISLKFPETKANDLTIEKIMVWLNDLLKTNSDEKPSVDNIEEKKMIVKISDNEAVEISIDEREFKMLKMCEQYGEDPFGSPNHLLMVLVAKLWNYIKEH
jgi:hypothetical protein